MKSKIHEFALSMDSYNLFTQIVEYTMCEQNTVYR